MADDARIARDGVAALAAIALGCIAISIPGERHLLVTATAYNSLRQQTADDPEVAAWGDRLEPGMKVVAVSHDLVGMGLTRGVQVRIDGLAGKYTVLDKTASRWERRIDIYMGTDVRAARAWGKRLRRIHWEPET